MMEEEYGTQRYWDMSAISNETTLNLVIMERVVRERAYMVAAKIRAARSRGEPSNDPPAARTEHTRRLAAIEDEWQVICYNRLESSGLDGLQIKDDDGGE